jgi:hypothetical protein
MPSAATIEVLLSRYGGASLELLDRVLVPYRLRLVEIELGDKLRSARFKALVPHDTWTNFEEGTTGKVVPRAHVEDGAPWHEIVKGRILACTSEYATGELYFSSPSRLEEALEKVKVGDYLEVDPFGVSSKVESALCEASFFRKAEMLGFTVTRMPENVAKHVGTQNYFDFRLERDGKVYRVEQKSLWGTDTTKARLIHTVSKDGGGKNSTRADRQTWFTSSCRFQDQDIFAVSMWLRTGRVDDFAFAASVPASDHPDWGLPVVPKHPSHVTQNPPISDPPSGPWTSELNEVCGRVDTLREISRSRRR